MLVWGLLHDFHKIVFKVRNKLCITSRPAATLTPPPLQKISCCCYVTYIFLPSQIKYKRKLITLPFHWLMLYVHLAFNLKNKRVMFSHFSRLCWLRWTEYRSPISMCKDQCLAIFSLPTCWRQVTCSHILYIRPAINKAILKAMVVDILRYRLWRITARNITVHK
jgi:hypothetical protein